MNETTTNMTIHLSTCLKWRWRKQPEQNLEELHGIDQYQDNLEKIQN
jgi:hypothetical protein